MKTMTLLLILLAAACAAPPPATMGEDCETLATAMCARLDGCDYPAADCVADYAAWCCDHNTQGADCAAETPWPVEVLDACLEQIDDQACGAALPASNACEELPVP